MADIINIRDFKRREEREAADVRLAKQVMGLTDGQVEYAHELACDRRQVWLDTAPCEMPQVQPSYTASDRDPA